MSETDALGADSGTQTTTPTQAYLPGRGKEPYDSVSETDFPRAGYGTQTANPATYVPCGDWGIQTIKPRLWFCLGHGSWIVCITGPGAPGKIRRLACRLRNDFGVLTIRP